MGSNWSEENINEQSNMAQNQYGGGLESRKFKNPGVAILKEILRSIKLDERLVKENNAILHDFLNSFVSKMKEQNDLFKFLYNAPFFTGSFYSDLRVSMPDEFDINLVLKLPFRQDDFEILNQYHAPSYVKYRLKNHEEILKDHPLLVSTFFEDGYLIPEKVRTWIQSVVDRALINYPPPKDCIRVSTKQAGPARTILIRKRNGDQIDIDLVPVISCSLDLPRNNLDGRVSNKVGGSSLKAFLVPKPFGTHSGKQMPINRTEVRRLWRSHFPEAEEKIIHNVGCVKPIIKLLKLLRDKEDWKILASYYLKTVVMWMIIENSNKTDYWKEDKMHERFIEVLQELANWTKINKIPYIFNKKYNLIEKMNDDQAINIYNRLNFLIKKIQENPNRLWNTFKIEPAFYHS